MIRQKNVLNAFYFVHGVQEAVQMNVHPVLKTIIYLKA